jgi:hypothetical protein
MSHSSEVERNDVERDIPIMIDNLGPSAKMPRLVLEFRRWGFPNEDV